MQLTCMNLDKTMLVLPAAVICVLAVSCHFATREFRHQKTTSPPRHQLTTKRSLLATNSLNYFVYTSHNLLDNNKPQAEENNSFYFV